MEADDQGYRWPQDMERRRVAALRRFQRNNPNYKFMYEQLQGTSGPENRVKREKHYRPLRSPLLLSVMARKARGQAECNRWCLGTTLELLEEMKAYVRENQLYCLGEDIRKWGAIAINLTNPRGLALDKLARSCMVRFDNLRRYMRTGRESLIEDEVQDSVLDYFQICERQQSASLPQPASKAPVPTMKLALEKYRRPPSPPPPPSPQREKFCHRRTAVHSRKRNLHDSDDDHTSSSEDDSRSPSPPQAGSLQHRSKAVKTLTRIPPPTKRRDSQAK